jgi:hypothetical protein
MTAKRQSSTTAKPSRPTTCGALFEAGDAEHAAEGCGRLPRHNGDHRPTLTRPSAVKPASRRRTTKRRPLSAAKRRELRATLAAAVESGEMSASEALASYAAAL